MSIVKILSLHRKLKHKKKKKTKTEYPRSVMWMSDTIASNWKDTSTNGVCRGLSQGAGNTPSVVHLLTWLETCKLICNYEAAKTITTFIHVMGNIRRIVKNDCPNSHTNPSRSISMCHIYHHRCKHKNASSDDKCGIEIHMPNTKHGRISLERSCNNEITPDIIHDKMFAKRILIFHYLCRWH